MKKVNNKPDDIIKVAKYIRVSTVRQAKTGDSLREQDDTLNEFINTNDNMILYDTYIDDGISGQKLVRDDFSRLMNDLRAGKFHLIIFTKLDRWFRSLRHYLNTQAILEEYGVSWKAVSQPYFDTSSAVGRTFVAQSMSWAEMEAQTDSERIIAVFDNKVKNGEAISGVQPLGYKVIDKHVVIDPDTAPKVLELFKYYRRNPNLRATMRYAINDLGINRSYTQIRRILTNEKYIGIYRENKNYCPAIIPVDLFREIGELVKKNIRSNKKFDYIFSGLVFCGECGYKMSACSVRQRRHKHEPEDPNNPTHYRYPSYRCQGYSQQRNCRNGKQFYETTLEKRLLAMLRPALEQYITEYDISTAPVVNNAAKRNSIERKIVKLKELYINELITLNEFKIDRAKYEKELSELRDTIPVIKDLSTIRNLLNQDFESLYDVFNFEDKRYFWRSFIKEIRIYNDHRIDLTFL